MAFCASTWDWEEECLVCCIRLLIDCNIFLHSALLHFPCLNPLALPPPPLPFHSPTSPEARAPCRPARFSSVAFCFQQSHSEDVCYGGPVGAASTGAKSSGARLNGWAVRHPVLWRETQTSCRLRWGTRQFLSNTTAKEFRVSKLTQGWAVVCGSSEGWSGEYGLHLCFIKSMCGTHIAKWNSKDTHKHICTQSSLDISLSCN